ncbi:P-loop ATPase, partial [Acinetobacter rongchengensis]
RRSSVDSINESELYKLIMDLELNIKDTFINKLLNAYDIAKKSDDSKYHLENIMKDVAIYEYDHSNNFIKDWQSYILRGL